MNGSEHPVLRLIESRKREQSQPGRRTDNAKLALAIEGGGMRGIVSAGMVTALHYLGLRDVFDVVYGTSAGAINGAYFLSGQAPYGSTIYYDEINNRHFLSLARAAFGSPIMSLDFLFDDVMISKKILDWHSVIRSNPSLKVISTSLNGPQTVVFEHFGSREELLRALRASVSIPFIAGSPIKIEGQLYSDGGLLEPIPFRSAIAAGCTHVLALLTRRSSLVTGNARFFDLYVGGRYLSRFGVDGKMVMETRASNYASDVKRLAELSNKPSSEPFVYVIQPPESCPPIGRLEKQREILLSGAISGMKSTFSAFGKSPNQFIEVIAPFGNNGRSL